MKRPCGVVLVLVVVLTIGLASPLLATSVACPEDGGTDCCGLECATCLCCSHVPQTALSEPDRHTGDPDGGLRPDEAATPREPLPRDVLHVPKAAPLR